MRALFARLALASCLLILGLTAAGGPAQAAAGFGSAAFSTARPCGDPPDTACSPVGKTTSLEDGGRYRQAATGFDLGNGSSSAMATGFGPEGLADLHGAAASASNQRVGADGALYSSYQYRGGDTIALALDAVLQFANSGDSGVVDAFGDGTAYGFVVVFRDDNLGGLPADASPDDVFNCVVGITDCWTFRRFGDAASTGLSGANSLDIGVAPVRLFPGDRFVIATGLQLIGNRGGFASGDLSVGFDPENSFFFDSDNPVTRQFLDANIVRTVPEPGVWLLLILGFGATGAAIRRRGGVRRHG